MTVQLPHVSIITPAYNSARFLTETIDSVLNQDYPNVEHIIVDGGSTDGTLEILNRYPHLKWVSEPDRGQSHAINKGFSMAGGQILGWINADDTYNPSAISTAVDFLLANPDIDLVYSDWQFIDLHSLPIKVVRSRPFFYDLLLSVNYIPQPTVFFRRAVFEVVGGVNEDLHYCMDREFWLRIGTKYNFGQNPGHIAANFRVHPEAKSSGYLSRFHAEWLDVLQDSLKNPLYSGIPESKIRRAVMQTRTRMHLSQITESLKERKITEFGRSVLRLVINDWKYMVNYALEKTLS